MNVGEKIKSKVSKSSSFWFKKEDIKASKDIFVDKRNFKGRFEDQLEEIIKILLKKIYIGRCRYTLMQIFHINKTPMVIYSTIIKWIKRRKVIII